MRAAVMYGAGDVRVEDYRPDPKLRQPTDAVVRVLRAAICGSDLWPYASMPATDAGPAAWAMSSSASSRTPAPT